MVAVGNAAILIVQLALTAYRGTRYQNNFCEIDALEMIT